ncbi:NAD(P)H-dependent oxidoreductase [Actinomyces sp. MRS3W]|uniref:NAD(P)H-dependent oxidoreductase n=1 Tax=Actinomyces sp. MRS3W TaxID=2800796 RepID=UPI0028FD9A70|nr:NAD(P)H-dependent oxidoreductase [Actinomyces sp. MRS3W]MDU0348002.1 NAD(P)H-dependent oxidoreductase [Actinomyces sp. MRS3W]
MTTTVLVFHPRMDASRVNARLARAAEDAAAAGADVQVRRLYELYPDFRIDVEAEKRVLEAADRIVLQFPMYWYSCPPLVKQWEDDVLEHGWAYGSTGTALHGKELALAVSPGAPAANYDHEGSFHYTVTDLLRPFQATSNLIGTRFLKPFVTTGTLTLSDADLEAQAAAYAAWLTDADLEELGTFE